MNKTTPDITYYVYHKNEQDSVLINTLTETQNEVLQQYIDGKISEIKFDGDKVKSKIFTHKKPFSSAESFTFIVIKSKRKPISYNMLSNYHQLVLGFSSSVEKSTQKTINDTRRILHNIISLNSINNQEFDLIFSPESLDKIPHKKVIDLMNSTILKDSKSVARSILKINKNNNEIKYELDTFRYLMNPRTELRKSKQNLHKVTKRILDTFFVDFLDANITVNLITENNKIIEKDLNFDCLRYAIYNLFDNALKYCKRNSVLDIIISDKNTSINIAFSMFSHIINDNEVDKIFLDGFRGQTANLSLKKGDGIGLFMTRNLLNRINSTISLERKEKITDKSIQYQKNIFTIDISI